MPTTSTGASAAGIATIAAGETSLSVSLSGIKIPTFTRDINGALKRKKVDSANASAKGAKSRESANANEPKVRKTAAGVAGKSRESAGKAANERMAAKPTIVMENWTPLARKIFIGKQRCACCGKVSESIVGDLIEYAQRDSVGGTRTIRTRAFSATDSRYAWAALPKCIEYMAENVEMCAECLRVEEIFDTAFSAHVPMQLPLAIDPNPEAPEALRVAAGTILRIRAQRGAGAGGATSHESTI